MKTAPLSVPRGD